MKHLGLSKKEDLPEFGKFQELLKVFDAQNQTPVAGASSGEYEKQPPQ
jgi:hypothetical protein